jgi:hypothetical protein
MVNLSFALSIINKMMSIRLCISLKILRFDLRNSLPKSIPMTLKDSSERILYFIDVLSFHR